MNREDYQDKVYSLVDNREQYLQLRFKNLDNQKIMVQAIDVSQKILCDDAKA